MNLMKRLNQLLPVLLLSATFTLGAAADAAAQTVRVVFFSGVVTVKSGGRSVAPKLGQQLKASDQVVVGSGGSVQLSVNGKVLRYTKPATVKVSDAIARAGTGENSVVANSVRTLAGASGAGRSSRSSVAGATRAGEEGEQTGYFDSVRTDAVNTGMMRVNGELSEATGINDALGALSNAAERMKREPVTILQPRSTAVTHDPILFRWKGSADIGTYVITVQNYLGEEVYRAETTDTFHVWPAGAGLEREAIYTWRIADMDRPSARWGANFHLVSDAEQREIEEGREAIVTELGGEENPAIPMLLGSFYAERDLFGQAAELFTQGAVTQPEHAGTYWEMACDQYLYNVYMPLEEAYRVCGGE